MKNIRDRKLRVKKQIIRAFNDVPYPGDRELARSGEAWFELFDFVGNDWKTMPSKIMEADRHLSIFSPKGFAYFLPAFLLFSISDPYTGYTSVFNTIGYFEALGDTDYEEAYRYHCSQLNALTSEQLACIGPFLGLMKLLTRRNSVLNSAVNDALNSWKTWENKNATL